MGRCCAQPVPSANYDRRCRADERLRGLQQLCHSVSRRGGLVNKRHRRDAADALVLASPVRMPGISRRDVDAFATSALFMPPTAGQTSPARALSQRRAPTAALDQLVKYPMISNSTGRLLAGLADGARCPEGRRDAKELRTMRQLARNLLSQRCGASPPVTRRALRLPGDKCAFAISSAVFGGSDKRTSRRECLRRLVQMRKCAQPCFFTGACRS